MVIRQFTRLLYAFKADLNEYQAFSSLAFKIKVTLYSYYLLALPSSRLLL